MLCVEPHGLTPVAPFTHFVGTTLRPVGQSLWAAWHNLPKTKRSRVPLVCLPMADIEENATMVNALQRHTAVIVQKSLHKGFGLTVTEAMWKGRPIVASAVGGIQDQIVDGKHGLLLKDPTDLKALGNALQRLLADPAFARRLGRNARRRAIAHFMVPRHLMQYAELLTALHRPAPLSAEPNQPCCNT
ncbi:MAG: glycosyltransferase [Candidatus Binatia bacterium]|nr:glycosyltransferase [Candidatus Binatia bacterium]|tara:strand:- start:301 stop:864 length:564 start_codon:yes stop_codon:yes gene_type:complete